MLETVIRNIWEKKKLMDLGDPRHEEIRIAALFPGGFMRGIFQVAEMNCFYPLGLEEVVDDFVGISVGAGPPTYFLGGQQNGNTGVSIWSENLVSTEFIDYRRVRDVVNWRYLYDVLRYVKPPNEKVIQESRSRLWFVLTDLETKQFVFFNAKKAKPDIIEALFCAITPPRATRKPILVNGREYCDGGFTSYLPFKEIYGTLEPKPTDILVIGNQSRECLGYNFGFIYEKLVQTMYRKYGANEMLKRRKDTHEENLDFLRSNPPVNIAFLNPPDCGIGFTTRNRLKLERAFQLTTTHTLNLFNQYKPSD